MFGRDLLKIFAIHGQRMYYKHLILKKIKVKKPKTGAGGLAQVVEHLPTKHKALTLNLSTAKKNRKERNWNIFV
jgi:hypothetical protein